MISLNAELGKESTVEFGTFAMSVANYEELRKSVESIHCPIPTLPSLLELFPFSMPASVVASPHLSSTAPTWVPPCDPFVEFEKKDEAWAKPLGFGKMEERKVFYAINTRAMNRFGW